MGNLRLWSVISNMSRFLLKVDTVNKEWNIKVVFITFYKFSVTDIMKNWFHKIFIQETSHTGIQFFRSIFVGGIASVVDIMVMILCKELFKMPESWAAVMAFIAGLTVNYIVSTFWVFSKAKVKNRAADFIGFAVIGIIGLGLTELIIAPFSEVNIFNTAGFLVKNAVFGSIVPVDKYYIIGKCLAIVLVYMWNFFARKFILYRKSEG